MKILKKIFILSLLLTVLFAETITYTAKDKVSVQGKANRNVKIEVYVNDRKTVETQTDGNGDWVAYDVPLALNTRNNIYAIAVGDNGSRSKTSTRLTVVVDTTIPQFLSAELSPILARPNETIRITARTDQSAANVKVLLPDNTELVLTAGAGNTWTGNWHVPQTISGGKHRVQFTAANRLGSTSQTQVELTIDSQGNLTVSAPAEGEIVYVDTIQVTGVALNSTQIEVGQDRTAVQSGGAFTLNHRLFKTGRNLVTVVATDVGGNKVERKINVIRLVTFPDIQSHWAKREIEYLATLGYVQAYPNSGMYAPERNITRAELAVLLVRARQLPVSAPSKSTFIDVPSNHWAAGFIETAAQYNIVEGYPGRVYKPTNFVTRAEAAAMFSRYAQAYSAPAPAYADVPANHWAAPTIIAFDNSGLTPPAWQNQQRFNPRQPITRAEVAAIMSRIKDINHDIEILLGENPNLETYSPSTYTPSSYQQSSTFAPPAEAGTAFFSYDGQTYVYPENYAAEQSAVSYSGELTRGQAAALLAKYGYLKQAIVNAPPAKDVPLSHPQVKAIKSAIVTGVIPNKSANTFAPNDRVSFSEASNIMKRAKVPAAVSGSGYVSAAEFERKIAK